MKQFTVNLLVGVHYALFWGVPTLDQFHLGIIELRPLK